jgi:8-oxo-dGTP pyrophosphatase MutT (NUDIX family)
MTNWRPPRAIRVIATGLAWNNRRLLASEVTDDSGEVKGVRPLGGSIEFGETREEALHREFMEELGCGISIVGPWHALENIFDYEGTPGHEIVFAADIELLDRSLYDREEILYPIESGRTVRAIWADPAHLAASDIQLYPSGLARQLGPMWESLL